MVNNGRYGNILYPLLHYFACVPWFDKRYRISLIVRRDHRNDEGAGPNRLLGNVRALADHVGGD